MVRHPPSARPRCAINRIYEQSMGKRNGAASALPANPETLRKSSFYTRSGNYEREFRLILSSVLHRTLRIQGHTQAKCTCQRATSAPIPLATCRQTTADMPDCQRSDESRTFSSRTEWELQPIIFSVRVLQRGVVPCFPPLFGQGLRFLVIGT